MIQESYKIRLISNDLFEALTKIAFDAWTARGELKPQPSKIPFKKVQKIISDKLGVYLERIHLDSKFMVDLKMDSMDGIELAMAFEDAFNIEITDEETSNLAGKTVGDVMELLEKKVN
jgi:acyl carrier protein